GPLSQKSSADYQRSAPRNTSPTNAVAAGSGWNPVPWRKDQSGGDVVASSWRFKKTSTSSEPLPLEPSSVEPPVLPHLRTLTPDMEHAASGPMPAAHGPGYRRAPAELSQIPLPPYIIEAPDILLVEAKEAVVRPDAPIRGQHLVRPDGTISLGIYGSV